MLQLYAASLGFGAVLIGVSILFGGADKDFDHDGDVDLDGEVDLDGDAELDLDHDHDLDLDHDHDLDAAPVDLAQSVEAELASLDSSAGLADLLWLPLFSMRFWTFGAAAFGFTGTALTLGGLPWWVVLLCAVLFGTGSGVAATAFFRALKKDAVTSTTTMRSFRGEEAEVLLPIEPGGRGKIKLVTATGIHTFVATSRDAESIPIGAKVLIAGVRDGVADVSALARPRAIPQTTNQESA